MDIYTRSGLVKSNIILSKLSLDLVSAPLHNAVKPRPYFRTHIYIPARTNIDPNNIPSTIPITAPSLKELCEEVDFPILDSVLSLLG